MPLSVELPVLAILKSGKVKPLVGDKPKKLRSLYFFETQKQVIGIIAECQRSLHFEACNA